jgi:hypothetical protein
MRLASVTAIAFTGALTIAHLSAQQQPPAGGGGGRMGGGRMSGMNMGQDVAHKVANGGIHGSGWQGRPDPGTGEVNDSSLAAKGADIEIHTGPAMLYWNTANKMTGDYTVSATITEPKFESSMDHPHPYGVFVAGNDLDGPNATALYCAVYGNGNVIVRAFPTSFAPMGNRRPTASEAAHKAAGKGEPVTQTVTMSVKGDTVDCSVNGKSVASLKKADLVGEGKLKSLDGYAGIRVAHNVDVDVKDFKVGK